MHEYVIISNTSGKFMHFKIGNTEGAQKA